MITTRGVLTVARLEFRLRIRAGRWRWLLAIWFVLLALVATGTRAGFVRGVTGDSAAALAQYRGAAMFGVLMLVVLALSLLVSPALAAQSVNGDRARGTLATLQVTRLRPAEIAAGKLAASWGTSLVFLAVTLPLAGWCLTEGGLSALRVAGVYLMMALLLGVACAVALGLSALLSSTTTSSVLAYLLVFTGTVGTLLAFVLVTALTPDTRPLSFQSCSGVLHDEQGGFVDRNGNPIGPGQPPVQTDCRTVTEQLHVTRPDRTWWLIAPNPFVVLADSAPAAPTVARLRPDGTVAQQAASFDPLGAVSRELRQIRSHPVLHRDQFGNQFYRAPANGAALWPVGLAVDLLLGAGGAVLTGRRLRTPARRLPRGQRVA
ncbi:MAG TPA: hypothetical protein VFX70_05485 [Mycobacteriales bacterium]|nr:hypothetical protein [Mycobacteriales bacterium]